VLGALPFPRGTAGATSYDTVYGVGSAHGSLQFSGRYDPSGSMRPDLTLPWAMQGPALILVLTRATDPDDGSLACYGINKLSLHHPR